MIFITKNRKNKIKKQLLEIIVEREDQVFQFVKVSKKLNLSYRQLFRLLLELENEKKIVTYQKYPTKTILIVVSEYSNYYWKVYIRSEKHPVSKIGSYTNK
ncbi:MAG: hypothetical protein ACK5LC_04755 [Coprobacillaceae bacterium]